MDNARGLRRDGESLGQSDKIVRVPGSGTAPSTKVLDDSRPWVGIVGNKGSGTGQGVSLIHRLADELDRLGLASRIALTSTERQHLVDSAGQDSGCRCLVAVGGDGTVGALLNEEPKVPVAILPAGTENLTAGHFRYRRNPHSLAVAIAERESRPVDLGLAAGRRFMLMAGFGFDGDVVTRHHKRRVGSSGTVRPTNRAAYVEPILKSSFSYRFPTIRVAIEDPGHEEILEGTTVFVFNLPRYALGLPFAPGARDDDGWLDLLVFRDPGPFRALYYLWRVLCRNHLRDPGVTHRRVRCVTLRSNDTVPVQLDGDPAGVLLPDAPDDSKGSFPSSESSYEIRSRTWRVEVLPAAVQMLVPVRSKKRLPFALAKEGRSG